MRNTLEVTMQRMSLLAKDGILLFWGIIASFGIILVPLESGAAIGTTTQNWPATPIYSNAAYPSAAITYNAVAGNNRLLVVGISSSTTAVNQAQPTVTYGGTSMTYAIGADATATRQHSYLFYLPLGSSAVADTGKTIVVTFSNGTSVYCIVNAAVYTGVDQTAPLGAAVRWSNGTTASNAIGPFTLAVTSGELGVSVLNGVTEAKINAPTIAVGTTGHIWNQVSTAASGKLIGALRTTFATTANVNAATATQHTTSGQAGALTVNSSAAMIIKPIQGITVANGSTVAGNKSVYVNDGANSNNVVVDAFSMTADAPTTVTGITFTANANTTSANVSAVKVWRKVGATLTAWEASDVLVGSGAATGGAVTISTNESVNATTKNYIVTYDIASGAAASTANILTGTITSITPSAIALTDTSAFSSSVYIYPTVTLGTGSEPAAARLWKSSSATNLDAFTLAHNSVTAADDDTISTVTVTMAPQYISGGSGGTISKIKLMDVVDSTGTVVYGSSNAATTGDTWNISTPTLTTTATPATYYIRVSTADTITPSVEDTSGTITGYYIFNGTVTALAHSKPNNRLVLGDSASQSLVIDVEKPIGPATATASTGAVGGEINLVWGAGSDNNGGSLHATSPYIVRRSAPDGTSPNPGCTDGTSVTLSAGAQSSRSFTDTGLIDTNPTRYYYRLCAQDSQGNVSSGAETYANAKVTSVCNTTPSVSLAGEDLLSTEQVIKSANTTPFKLLISNNDLGTCPDVDFNVALVSEENSTNFDKSVGATFQASLPFPATVTLGTGGAGAPTGKTLNVYITGKPTASQLELYKFAIQVTGAGHGTPPETVQVTGILNDMPPIVHNSSNMGKFQYGNWGQTFTCATCHSNSTTNIKGVYQIISTTYSGRRSVVFTKTSSSETDSDGVYSTDQRAIKNVSNNICSVCHHRTRQHQYSASKPFGGPSNDEPYVSDHHNSHDCVRCHTHNTAFRSIYGVCGDCHGFKATGYSPVSKNTMVKDLTNALGPNPPNYGAHQRHNIAKMTCGACHNNTNHGLATTAWSGDNELEIGFNTTNDTFPGFNPSVPIVGGTFYGTDNLNAPFVWTDGPNTTITPIADYNASCNTYCHGTWTGNSGSNTTPIWVGTGQTACGTCHNATGAVPPTSGSHAKHAANTGAGLGIACSKCHATYANYTGSAHINGNVEWKLYQSGATAAYKGISSGSTGAPAPTASINYGTCTNLYCHSNVQGAGGTGGPTSYANPAPVWGGTAPCGSCHAEPNTSGSHASHEDAAVAFDCHVCHNNGGTTSPLSHSNGIIDFQFVGLGQNTVYSQGAAVPVGTAYGTCSTSNCHGRFTRAWGTPASGLVLCDKCHGSATSPRGFYNTRGPDGTLSIYSAAIGVHDIHLQNPNSPRRAAFARFTSYTKGFSCRHCHSMPTGPFTAGHIDTPTPAEVPFSHMTSLANIGQTRFSYYSSPTYTSATQTCSSVWCHGAGMDSNNKSGAYAGVAGSIQRQNPKWDTPFLTGSGANDCAKCHAMPPQAPDSGYIHYGKTMVNCVECHTHLTDDGYGFKDKSLHVNGNIDGGCDKCHGYPPINNIVGDQQGLATPAQGALQLGTAGAHNAHVLNANIGKNCQTCHYNFNPFMTSNGSGQLEIGFSGYNGSVDYGTFTGYSDSGVHPKWVSTNPTRTTIQKVTIAANANVCSNLYCHGGGTATLPALGGGSKTNPNWEGGSGDAICGTCHGTDTTNTPTGGSHARHARADNGGIGMLCVSCHGSSTNMTHVNGAVSWRFDRSNPLYGANATYNNASSGKIVGLAPRANGADYHTCDNLYCHSDVQGADGNGTGGPLNFASPRWGTDNYTLHCGSCHKNMATDGSPTGSHLKHANPTAGMDVPCGYCHQDGGDGTAIHADGSVFVNFTSYIGGAYSAGAPYLTGMMKPSGSAAFGSCSATFCHGTVVSPAWGTVGPLACNACHGAKVDDVSWSGRHKTHYNYSTMPTNYTQTVTDLSTTNKYRFNCAHCHDDNVAKHSLKPASANSAARVFFGISSATPATSSKRGLYAPAGASEVATDNGFKFTAGSCNTSYCHSNGRGGAPKLTTLTWITAPSGNNCAYCHDTKSIIATATQLSGKHDKHMNPTNNAMMGTGNGFNCVDCHAPTITNINNTTIANKGKHVNAALNYSGARASRTGYTLGSGSCSTYCHSNGNPGVSGAPVFVSMTGSKIWIGAGTITTCNKCHGRSTSTGYPDYANGGANNVNSNLHAGHMSGLTDTLACADCHRKTADAIAVNKFRPYSTLHINGSRDVAFNKTKSYIGTNANAVTVINQVTCSNIVCHGQGAPVWGASNPTTHQCQKCHGSRVTAFGTFSSPQVAPGYGSDGTDTSMTKTLPTDPRVGAHQRHLSVSNVLSAPIKCGECHVTVTAIRSGNHWNYSTATLTFSGRATANSHTPTVSRSGGIIQCSNTNCHTGKYDSGTAITPLWNNTGLFNEAGNTVGDCVKCHAMAPTAYGSHVALNSGDLISSIYATCGGCHNNLSNSATDVSNAFVDKNLHINGIINASAACNSCHDYDTNGGTWGNVKNANYGGLNQGNGAHYKHIEYIKARWTVTLNASSDSFGSGAAGTVCGMCHSTTSGDHSMGTPSDPRTINFGGSTARQFGTNSNPATWYSGVSSTSSAVNPKRCSNLDCHYLTTPIWSTY